MFENCGDLVSITFTNSVTAIGWNMFDFCYDLKHIYFGGTKAEWNAVSKPMFWKAGVGSFTVHCTDGDIGIW